MRKFLIGLASLTILGLAVYVIIEGASFINVNGYRNISKLSNDLDLEIEKINNIKENIYVTKESELERETSALKGVREEYLAKIEAAKLKGAKGSKVQIEVFELDFIWGRVGSYATKYGLELKLDVFPGAEEQVLNDFKLYNLQFTVLGDYTDIVEFIYKIEGDSEISAQISDFKMRTSDVGLSSSDEDESDRGRTHTLVAEFTFKNVPLNYKTIMDDIQSDSEAPKVEAPRVEDNSNEINPQDEKEEEDIKSSERSEDNSISD